MALFTYASFPLLRRFMPLIVNNPLVWSVN